jgi:hypothetical protein
LLLANTERSGLNTPLGKATLREELLAMMNEKYPAEAFKASISASFSSSSLLPKNWTSESWKNPLGFSLHSGGPT